jgi:hypothetical protein
MAKAAILNRRVDEWLKAKLSEPVASRNHCAVWHRRLALQKYKGSKRYRDIVTACHNVHGKITNAHANGCRLADDLQFRMKRSPRHGYCLIDCEPLGIALHRSVAQLARAPVSKSTCSALYFKDHSEKLAKSDLCSINELDTDSECAGGRVALPVRSGAGLSWATDREGAG